MIEFTSGTGYCKPPVLANCYLITLESKLHLV